MSSSRKYAVVGLGVVAGPQPNRTRRQVAAEAVRLAIADGGLKRQDIDGAIEVVHMLGDLAESVHVHRRDVTSRPERVPAATRTWAAAGQIT